MSIPNSTSMGAKRLSTPQIIKILWSAAIGFVLIVGVQALLFRLGLPTWLLALLWTLITVGSVLILSAMGRTMTSTQFFYSARRAKASVTGFGGGTDWASGSFLLLFLLAGPGNQLVFFYALLLGVLISGIAIAPPFYRSGAATLSGFLTWRCTSALESRVIALVALACSLTSLAVFMLAELAVIKAIFAALFAYDTQMLLGTLVVLAVLPTVLGGWFSLIAINVVLALWIILAVTGSTFLFAFMTPPFAPGMGLQLPTITGFSDVLSGGLAGGSAMVLVLLLAGGVSVFPHALSRMALLRKAVAATEHSGWSALFVFVIISSSALSLEFIVGVPTEGTLRLQSQAWISLLPYFALALASYNALAACIMTFCSVTVRGIQRSRLRSPDDRSMFATRVLALLVAAVLIMDFDQLTASPVALWLLAVLWLSATLFVPAVTATWLSGFAPWTMLAMVASGAVLFAALLQPWAMVDLANWDHTFVWFGVMIWAIQIAVGVLGWFAARRYPHLARADADHIKVLRS